MKKHFFITIITLLVSSASSRVEAACARRTLMQIVSRPIRNSNDQNSHLIGFFRKKGKIKPVYSSQNEINSVRDLSGAGFGFSFGWNGYRKMEIIPLSWQELNAKPVTGHELYAHLPEDLKKAFSNGKVLVTDPLLNQKSEYSVLMATAGSKEEVQGRTGILLQNDKPVILQHDGVESLIEIKGVGSPDGGFHYKWNSSRGNIRGGATAAELRHEIQIGRELCAGGKCDVIALGGSTFNSPDGAQGYLIRAVPSSIRASFLLPDTIPLPSEVDRIVRGLAEQWGSALEQGLAPLSHVENLVLSDGTEHFAITDFGDVHRIGAFPTEKVTAQSAATHSLMAIREISGYRDARHFPIFRSKISAVFEARGHTGLSKKIQSAENLDDIGDLIWEDHLKPIYWRQKAQYGSVPDLGIALFSKYRDNWGDPNYFSKNFAKNRQLLTRSIRSEQIELKTSIQNIKEYQRMITKLKNSVEAREEWKKDWSERHRGLYSNSSEVEKHLKGEISTAPSRLAEYGKMMDRQKKSIHDDMSELNLLDAVSDSPEKAWEVLKPKAVASVTSRAFADPYRILYEVFGDAFDLPRQIADLLEKEVKMFGDISPKLTNSEAKVVLKNREIAQKRIQTLKDMSPFEAQRIMQENPDYWIQMSMLPYHSDRLEIDELHIENDEAYGKLVERVLILKKEGKLKPQNQ